MTEVRLEGNSPIPSEHSIQYALLSAAWAYGLKTNDVIHRLALFTFVQSHLYNKKEETLQRTIESDILNWKNCRNGNYMLTQNGYGELKDLHKPDIELSLNLSIKFSRILNSSTISVLIHLNKPSYIVFKDDVQQNAKYVIDFIEKNTNEIIPKSQTSLPRKVFNWILSSNEYFWEIN